MGDVVEFPREREEAKPNSTLEMLIEHWGEGDPSLEGDIRRQCGDLLEQYSAVPGLALQLPVVESLPAAEQAALTEALREQINLWANQWHSKLLFELLGAEILRLRERHGYGAVPGQS